MKALFLRENLRLSLEETDKPTLQNADDIILKVTATTICGSDLHMVHGMLYSLPDFIIGHEFVGVVDEVGTAVQDFKPGDRVVVPSAPFCGQCDKCLQGNYHLCRKARLFGWRIHPKYHWNGGQAEYVRVPFANTGLLHTPDSVTDEQALFIGDILSTAYFAVTNANLSPGQSIAIFGAGPVGLCAVACAKLFSPSHIILIDMEENRLAMGARLGATHTLKAGPDMLKQLKGIIRQGVDVALDAAGVPATLSDSIDVCTKGGFISVAGVGPSEFPVRVGELFMKNLTVKSGLVNLAEMPRLLKLVECGHLDLTPILTHEMPLDDIIEAYRIFDKREDGCIKVLLRP
ncbi:MAG: alcohol dehydrogenase catalytic domain-containing protein [Syntrophomonadaceae bacterium]|nr:alcohol dehydrogenase catalytic domain-containing protein [Syntrophomonadaceae bacterium]